MRSQKRSMSDALKTADLPSEALALIKGGTMTSTANRVAPVQVAAVSPGEAATAGELENLPKTVRSRNPQRELEPAPASGMAHLSIRLPADIPEALLRASLERKLKRVKPWTQQDIVSEALLQWLKRNGG